MTLKQRIINLFKNNRITFTKGTFEDAVKAGGVPIAETATRTLRIIVGEAGEDFIKEHGGCIRMKQMTPVGGEKEIAHYWWVEGYSDIQRIADYMGGSIL